MRILSAKGKKERILMPYWRRFYLCDKNIKLLLQRCMAEEKIKEKKIMDGNIHGEVIKLTS